MTSVRHICGLVTEYFEITAADLRRQDRRLPYVRPRQVAMYLARKYTRASLPVIGWRLRRDSTTVLAGARRIAELRRCDPDLDLDVRDIEQQLEGGR